MNQPLIYLDEAPLDCLGDWRSVDKKQQRTWGSKHKSLPTSSRGLDNILHVFSTNEINLPAFKMQCFYLRK